MDRDQNNMNTIKQYAFIRDYINKHGYAPTLEEIGIGLGQKSKSTTNYHQKKLFNAGFLETDLEVTSSPRGYRLGKNPFGGLNERT